MERITITIAADGSLSYGVQGVKGSSCTDLTKFIDDMAGVKSREVTGEYCEAPNNLNIQNKGS